MKSLVVSMIGFALLTSGFVSAQQVNPNQPREMRGRVVQINPTHYVVRTLDDRQIGVYFQPATKFVMNNLAIKSVDVRIGNEVHVAFFTEGDRQIANTVTVLSADVALPPNNPPAPLPGEGTLVEGQVVRVIGQDQVVIRTTGDKEIVIYVHPQTTYQFNNQPGRWTDVQPGTQIQAYYTVRDGRQFANRILGRPRR